MMSRKITRIAQLLFICLPPVTAQAETTATEQNLQNGEMAAQMAVGLLAVLGVIAMCVWLVKRLGVSPSSGQGKMRVLATLPVGQKERVMLIKAGEKQILIGVTANQISSLHTFDQLVEENVGAESKPFAIRLQEMLTKGNEAE